MSSSSSNIAPIVSASTDSALSSNDIDESASGVCVAREAVLRLESSALCFSSFSLRS